MALSCSIIVVVVWWRSILVRRIVVWIPNLNCLLILMLLRDEFVDKDYLILVYHRGIVDIFLLGFVEREVASFQYKWGACPCQSFRVVDIRVPRSSNRLSVMKHSARVGQAKRCKFFIKGDICARENSSTLWYVDAPSCLIAWESNEDATNTSLNGVLRRQLLPWLTVLFWRCSSVDLGDTGATEYSILFDLEGWSVQKP